MKIEVLSIQNCIRQYSYLSIPAVMSRENEEIPLINARCLGFNEQRRRYRRFQTESVKSLQLSRVWHAYDMKGHVYSVT